MFLTYFLDKLLNLKEIDEIDTTLRSLSVTWYLLCENGGRVFLYKGMMGHSAQRESAVVFSRLTEPVPPLRCQASHRACADTARMVGHIEVQHFPALVV